MAFVYCAANRQHLLITFFFLRLNLWQRRETHILVIRSETMVDARRHDGQITLFQPQTDPIVTLAPDVKVTRAIQDVPDLFVFVQVLVEEDFDFFFVVWQGGGRDCDFVAVLVVAGRGEVVDRVQGGEIVADDAEFGEVGGGDGAAAVVGEALVALLRLLEGGRGGRIEDRKAYLDVVVPVCLHVCCGCCGGIAMSGRRNSGGVAWKFEVGVVSQSTSFSCRPWWRTLTRSTTATNRHVISNMGSVI